MEHEGDEGMRNGWVVVEHGWDEGMGKGGMVVEHE